MMQPIKVLIADDHYLVREGIKSLLSDVKEIIVVGEASDGNEAVNFVKTNSVDVVLMDIDMPQLNGIEATKVIMQDYEHIAVIGLSMHNSKKVVEKMIHAGAVGYLLKNTDAKTLIFSIKNVKSNMHLIDKNIQQIPSSEKGNSTLSFNHSDSVLTEKELDVLKLVAEGLSNKEIGEALFISAKTVDARRTAMMRKLNVHNVVGLVKYAIANGLTT
jgi:DNA-binding NarL/FixJ family response regulator